MKQARVATCRDRLARFEIEEREAEVFDAGPRFEAIPDAKSVPRSEQRSTKHAPEIGLGPATPLPEYIGLVAKSQPTLRPHTEMGTGIFRGKLAPQNVSLQYCALPGSAVHRMSGVSTLKSPSDSASHRNPLNE